MNSTQVRVFNAMTTTKQTNSKELKPVSVVPLTSLKFSLESLNSY